MITKETFILGYMVRSRVPIENRTADGFLVGSEELVCIECDCIDDTCEGFAMISRSLYERSQRPEWVHPYELAK